MVPRRNPEIAVVVLQEHGDWGANSALIAQKIVIAYVNKKRGQDHNLLQQAGTEQKPVEVGAVWSNPEPADPKHGSSQTAASDGAGHFFVNPAQASKDLASTPVTSLFPAFVTPIRWRKEGQD